MNFNPIEINVNQHHFGFGALELDKVIKTPGQMELTGRMPSNKFKEKISLKQRRVEVSIKFLTVITQELMMENRIKKLNNEEERLKKQIAIANKHSVLADEVSRRNHSETTIRIR